MARLNQMIELGLDKSKVELLTQGELDSVGIKVYSLLLASAIRYGRQLNITNIA